MKLFNKNDFDIKSIITISLWGILSLFLVFFIFYGCKSYLNYDASFLVDYAVEQIRTKSIFPAGWYESNDFWIYSLIPLINVFVRLGMSLLASRQLSVLIQSIAIFALLYKLFYDKTNKESYWVPALLLLSGISGQILYELFGDGGYGSLIFYILLVLFVVQKFLEKKETKDLVLIGFILLFLSILSLKFPIYISAPLIMVLIYLYLENGLKREYLNLAITIAASFIIGYLIHNILCDNLLYVVNFEKEIVANKDMLEENLQQVIFQIFSLFGATNTLLEYGYWDINALRLQINSNSIMTIFIFVRYIFAIGLFVLPFTLRKKINEFSLKEKLVYLYTIALLIILSFFLIICGMSFWYKYLIPVIFMLTTFYIIFYRHFIKDNVRAKVLFIIMLLLFIIYSIFININFAYSFENKQLRQNYYQGLTDFLVDNDLSFGYEYVGTGKNIYTLLSNGKVRVDWVNNVNGRLEPYLWLSSKTWYEQDKHKGKIFFMRLASEMSMIYEERADYVLDYQLDYENNMKIFVYEDSDVLYDAIDIGDLDSPKRNVE